MKLFEKKAEVIRQSDGIEYGEMQIIAEIYYLLRFHCKK
jgi:6-phosphogluconate dehydrogenase